jgi:hypothetical protein
MSHINACTHAYLMVDLIAQGIAGAATGDRDAVATIAHGIDRVAAEILDLDEGQLRHVIDTMSGLIGDVFAAVRAETGSVDLARRALLDGPYSGGRVEVHADTQEIRYRVA